jgi:hypothetical protein
MSVAQTARSLSYAHLLASNLNRRTQRLPQQILIKNLGQGQTFDGKMLHNG